MYKHVKDIITGEVLTNQIIRISDNAHIPCVEDNSDYQKYLKWLDGYENTIDGWVKTSEGNTTLPADE